MPRIVRDIQLLVNDDDDHLYGYRLSDGTEVRIGTSQPENAAAAIDAAGAQRRLAASTGVFVSAAVSTEQVVQDIVIPGGLLGDNGELLVSIQGRGTGTGNKNFLIYFGGVLLGSGTASSTNITGTCQFRIVNITRNSQVGQPNGLRSLGESTTLPLTGAVNTDVDQTLSIRVSKATTGETWDITYWRVWYIPPFV